MLLLGRGCCSVLAGGQGAWVHPRLRARRLHRTASSGSWCCIMPVPRAADGHIRLVVFGSVLLICPAHRVPAVVDMCPPGITICRRSMAAEARGLLHFIAIPGTSKSVRTWAAILGVDVFQLAVPRPASSPARRARTSRRQADSAREDRTAAAGTASFRRSIASRSARSGHQRDAQPVDRGAVERRVQLHGAAARSCHRFFMASSPSGGRSRFPSAPGLSGAERIGALERARSNPTPDPSRAYRKPAMLPGARTCVAVCRAHATPRGACQRARMLLRRDAERRKAQPGGA